MRVVFLGSPPFAAPVFERVAACGRHTLAGLVTPPDRPRGRGREVAPSPLVERARAAGIALLQPERARGAEFVAALRALAPEVLLVASYGEILRQDVLDLPPRGCFNVHASLLPRHRGASPIQAAILAGDAETGVCVQRMVLALDEGDLVDEERTAIGAHETAGELLTRLSLLGATVALRALDAIESGTAVYTPQDPAHATYARKIEKHDGRIDWSRDADAIDRHVRAMTPWPGAHTGLPGGGELVLLDVRPRAIEHAAAPGALLDASAHAAGDPARRGEMLVACGRGALAVLALKPAGKGRMEGAAWLRGARLAPGSALGAA